MVALITGSALVLSFVAINFSRSSAPKIYINGISPLNKKIAVNSLY
jgi:hypothetical protein